MTEFAIFLVILIPSKTNPKVYMTMKLLAFCYITFYIVFESLFFGDLKIDWISRISVIPTVFSQESLSENIVGMFISQMWNVPNVEVIFFRMVTSQNKQKGFALYCYHFANLEGHAVRALFSPVSLPAT